MQSISDGTEQCIPANLPEPPSHDERHPNQTGTSETYAYRSDSALCSNCDTIVISDRGSTWKHDAGTIHEVQRSAMAGCRFCTLLQIALDLDLQVERQGAAWAQQTAVVLYQSAYAAHIRLQPQPELGTSGDVSLILDSKPEYNGEHLDMSASRIQRPEPDDQVSVELVKSWLENCLQNHERCGNIVCSGLPTRVLCVGAQVDQYIKVWEPRQGTKGGYIALSYCWGNGAAVTATPEELPRLLDGFSLTELPKTLRQAVQVTRSLGFRFLWVDSLCILQGKSAEALRDWIHESACMGEVFANAAVTISASASSSCDKGLFYPRTCKMPYRSSAPNRTQEEESVTLSINRYSRLYHDEPIHKRAWVFQERLLSQRVLSYCLQDMMWHCNEAMIWERDEPGHIHRTHKERLQNNKFTWDMIAMAYASRSLTDSKDKLPALSAVAKMYQKSRNDEYLAGIWRNELPKALLWTRNKIGHMNLARIEPRAPSEYRAPSWSWASLDCNIFMLPTREIIAEVVDCTVVLATTDPFGMVSAARIVLKCPYLEGTVVIRGGKRFCVGSTDVATFWLDENQFIKRQDADTSKPTIAALIAQNQSYYGLLLRSSKSAPNCYVRIGIFCSLTDLLWKQAETKALTII